MPHPLSLAACAKTIEFGITLTFNNSSLIIGDKDEHNIFLLLLSPLFGYSINDIKDQKNVKFKDLYEYISKSKHNKNIIEWKNLVRKIPIHDLLDKIYHDIEIEKVAINIVSVLTSLSEVKARPVKGPVVVKGAIPYKEILLIILCLVIVSAIIWVLSKRIKYIYPKNSYSIIKSPIEIANDRLSILNKKGFAKEFYSELSHITREYIEYSTYIRTLEMTTEEIIGNRDLFHFDDDSFSQWTDLLSKADLVKYAKQSIEPYEIDIDKDKVIDFINNLSSQ